MIKKKCSKCKKEKLLIKFSLNKYGTHGRQAYCKECAYYETTMFSISYQNNNNKEVCSVFETLERAKDWLIHINRPELSITTVSGWA